MATDDNNDNNDGYITKKKKKMKKKKKTDDPLELLQLAIQLDAAQHEKGVFLLLHEPLRLYHSSSSSSHEEEMTRAMSMLLAKTHHHHHHHHDDEHHDDTTSTHNNNNRHDKTKALTPIILSALLSFQLPNNYNDNDDTTTTNNNNNYNNNNDINYNYDASELVTICNGMRRQALQNIYRKQQRKRYQLRSVGLCIILTIFFGYNHTMTRWQYLMKELGYIIIIPIIPTIIPTIPTNNNNDHDHEQKLLTSCFVWNNVIIPTHDDESYREACQLAEGTLWVQLRDFALIPAKSMSTSSSSSWYCTRTSCSQDNQNIIQQQLVSRDYYNYHDDVGPYVMHTILQRESLQQQQSPPQSTFSSLWLLPTTTIRQQPKRKGLEWLGQSIVYDLIQTRLLLLSKSKESSSSSSFQNNKTEFRLLDVGCGVGALAYAIKGGSVSTTTTGSSSIRHDRWYNHNNNDNDDDENDNNDQFWRDLEYIGIALGSAEITHARRLSARHDLSTPTSGKVHFYQQSFDDDSTNQDYVFRDMDAVVAVESLSFSQNITKTLMNLARVMKRGGILIVVDNVLHTVYGDGAKNTTTTLQQVKSRMKAYAKVAARPSLLTHLEWIKALESSGFTVNEAVDLGLEYALPQLLVDDDDDDHDDDNRKNRRSWWRNCFRRVRLWGERQNRDLFVKVLNLWESWAKRRGATTTTTTTTDASTLQTIQLIKAKMHFLQSEQLRKQAYQRLDLTYNMYVCTKR